MKQSSRAVLLAYAVYNFARLKVWRKYDTLSGTAGDALSHPDLRDLEGARVSKFHSDGAC